MSEKQKRLINLGPFRGLDAATADYYISPGFGTTVSNADPFRVAGGLCSSRGRTYAFDFSKLLPGYAGTITNIKSYVAQPSQIQYIALTTPTAGINYQMIAKVNPLSVSPTSYTIKSLLPIQNYTEAVQFSDTMYFNNGRQVRGSYPNGTKSPANYRWHYQAWGPQQGQTAAIAQQPGNTNVTTASFIVPPPFTAFGISIGNAISFPNGAHFSVGTIGGNYVEGYILSGGGIIGPTTLYVMSTITSGIGNVINSGSVITAFLQGATYNYAFTSLNYTPETYTPPDFGGFAVPQESTASGANYPYSFSTTTTQASQQAVGISGNFVGTNDDGSLYYTNVYRYSSNAPEFIYLTTLKNNNTFVDCYDDAYIAQNASLLQNRDAPPNNGANLCPIESHKDRMWSATVIQNSNTYNRPQCQVWYSTVGRGWEFDSVNQVLLCGEEDTANTPYEQNDYGSYADAPVALKSLSSILCLLKKRTFWSIVGDDETDFLARKLFDIGCVSEHSATKGEGALYWLSESGVFVFDGSSGPQYISGEIKNALEAIPIADQQNSWGMFSNRQFFLSFPTSNITYVYDTVAAHWRTLPYATSAVDYIEAFPTYTNQTGSRFGQILALQAVQAGTIPFTVDSWDSTDEDSYYVLGANQFTWTTPYTASETPAYQHVYRYLSIEAPQQASTTATVTLTLEGGFAVPGQTFSYTFDLSQGQTFKQWPLPQGCRGTSAKVTVTAQQSAVTPNPVVIWNVSVWGTPDRELVQFT